MPRPPRHTLYVGAAMYALAEWLVRRGDALFNIPPGVEARHSIWED